MNTPVEEQFLGVLQNLELGIRLADDDADDLTDLEVGDILDALIQTYYAEATGRSAPKLRLSPSKRAAYDYVWAMCEWNLGRYPEGSLAESLPPHPIDTPHTPDEIVACLKRLKLSVKRWSSQGGRRGYLEFIRNYV